MSSMYTESHPRATSRRKMVFIIIWNVAGELVSPKNITVGSNRPSCVRNAAFHLSPSLMRILLYPQRISNFVNRVQPAKSIDYFRYERGDISIFLCPFVNRSIVLYWVEFAIFLFDKEKICCIWSP